MWTTTLEFLQLVIACIGFGFVYWRMWIVGVNAANIPDTPPGGWRRAIAINAVRAVMARLLIQFFLIIMGVISVLLHTDDEQALQIILLRGGLISVTIVVAVDAILENRHYNVFMRSVNGE